VSQHDDGRMRWKRGGKAPEASAVQQEDTRRRWLYCIGQFATHGRRRMLVMMAPSSRTCILSCDSFLFFHLIPVQQKAPRATIRGERATREAKGKGADNISQ
jgi:hypothetical protein